MSRTVLALLALAAFVLPASARASFGIEPGSLTITASNSDGTPDTLAGSHPASFTLHFKLNTEANGHTEGGQMRNVLVALPPGLVGDPQTVLACPQTEFSGFTVKCPVETQVGVLHASGPGLGEVLGPLYNLQPPSGSVTEFGFNAAGFLSLQFASVLPEEGYGVSVSAVNTPIEATEITERLWGVPAASYNDGERYCNNKPGCTSGAPLNAYLTLPTSCGQAPRVKVSVDSLQEPGHYVSETASLLDPTDRPQPMTACQAVPFTPEVSAQPTSRLASNPSGLDYELSLHDHGLAEPGGIAETEPEKEEVALPEGVTANPSAAEGLGVCTQAQYHAEGLNTPAGAGCPAASKIGSFVAHSPALQEPIEGSLFLAQPYANQAKTLIGLYVVARAPERGIMIKQFGRVEPDPGTGRLITTFEGLPPLPYYGFTLHFREGAQSLLVTPPVCGTYHTISRLFPFSAPEGPVTVDSTFQIDHGVDGGACPAGSTPPFSPSIVAGTQNNAAASYSPVYMRIERKDGEQEITGFSTKLPPGVSGNLSGIPFCGESEIQHAREQTGAEAETSPACPAASEIGHTVSEAGVGSVLAQTPGKLYLSGPFEGAPFSVVNVTSAKVGPFDLGTVVVHLPLNIDPTTAQVSIPSGPADQIPHIIKGIVIHLRTIRVYIDKQDFTLNPTSCEPMSLSATVIGSGQNFASPADDVSAPVNSRFQAADCAGLQFKPTFKVSVGGKTSRKNGASLNVKLTYPKEALGKDTNIHSVKVNLPKQLPSRLTTLQKACTSSQFEANPAGCPAASRVGEAIATTPILPVPLTGPAYFVSHGGAKFPELILVLQGYGVTIDLHGETFISKTGITSSTFHSLPDQPVASFELTLPQGPNSALAANGNLCATKLAMPTQFNAQNGAIVKQSTPITVTGCPKKKVKHKAKKARKAGRRHATGQIKKG